ncbi:MAG: putative peptidoglycan binding domain-containing protein, partial [Actinomycetota bacterium]
VVSPRGGYGGTTDIVVDLRVDDHPAPCAELARLLELHHLYFDKPTPEDLVPIERTLAGEIKERLRRLGYEVGRGEHLDATTRHSLEQFAGWENLEERLVDGPQVDRHILDALRAR